MDWNNLIITGSVALIGIIITYFLTKRSDRSKIRIAYCDSLTSLLGQYYAGIENCQTLFTAYRQAAYIARETNDLSCKTSAKDLKTKYESCNTQIKTISSTIETKFLLVGDDSKVQNIVDKIKKCLNDIDDYFSPTSKNLEGLDEKVQDLKALSDKFIKSYK